MRRGTPLGRVVEAQAARRATADRTRTWIGRARVLGGAAAREAETDAGAVEAYVRERVGMSLDRLERTGQSTAAKRAGVAAAWRERAAEAAAELGIDAGGARDAWVEGVMGGVMGGGGGA